MELLPSRPGQPPDASVDAFIQQLADAHRQFAADLAVKVEEALLAEERRAWEASLYELRRENAALVGELAEARRVLDLRRIVRASPRPDPSPLPRLPGSPKLGTRHHSLRQPPPIPPLPAGTTAAVDAAAGSAQQQGTRLEVRSSSSQPSAPRSDECGSRQPMRQMASERGLMHSPPLAPDDAMACEVDFLRPRHVELRSPPIPPTSPPAALGIHPFAPHAEGGEDQQHRAGPETAPGCKAQRPTSPTRADMTKRVSFMGMDDTDSCGGGPAARGMVRGDSMTPEPAQVVQEKLLRKQRLRLRNLLSLTASVRTVTADMIRNYIVHKYPGTRVEVSEIAEMLAAMKDAYRTQFGHSRDLVERHESAGYGRIELKLLCELLLTKDLLVDIDADQREDIEWLCGALLTVTLEEVIDDATNSHGRVMEEDDRASHYRRKSGPLAYSILSGAVAVTVVFNILCLGVSMDNNPAHKMWLVIEIVCVCVFVLEVCVKVWRHGLREYVFGADRVWNMMDFSITCLSLLDVGLSLFNWLSGKEGAEKGAARMVLILRALRLVRVIRLVKLLRTPMLEKLANMLTGFLIGLPALFWVVVLFLVVLFVIGLAFRIMFGPEEGQNMIDLCGFPDELVDAGSMPDPACEGRLHWLYGEEFFGTVWLSMFTTFRFMLGDYSSRKGVSLAIVLGQGYGPAFHLMFGIGMILCVFGLFNIVTAIFVDSTISGLKHNDSMRKYAQQYESKYVKRKLLQVIDRIAEVVKERSSGRRRVSHSNSKAFLARTTRFNRSGGDSMSPIRDMATLEGLTLSNDDFCEVMEDPMVRALLQDLDVDMYNPASFFETFDADDSGVVTVSEIVQSIIRLRGEVRKNDLIASVVAVRALNGRFDQLTLAMGQSALLPPSRNGAALVVGSVACDPGEASSKMEQAEVGIEGQR